MKSLLVFLVLMVFVVCPPPHFNHEERMKRRREFQKSMADCIVKSEGVSAELKKKIEDNKEEDLRKILHLYLAKLDSSDREIIRKCRRELFSKLRESFKDKWNPAHFNHSEPRPSFPKRDK